MLPTSSGRRKRRSAYISIGYQATAGLSTLAGGLFLFWPGSIEDDHQLAVLVRPLTAALLLAAAGVQVALLRRSLRRFKSPGHTTPAALTPAGRGTLPARRYLRWMLVGVVGGFFAVASFAPAALAGWWFATLLAWWHAAALRAAQVSSSRTIGSRRAARFQRAALGFGWSLYAAAVLLVAAEIGLRAWQAADVGPPAVSSSHLLLNDNAGGLALDNTMAKANRVAETPRDSVRPGPGASRHLRVALVGDAALLTPAGDDGLLASLGRLTPHVAIACVHPVASSTTSPRQLAGELADCRADVVLLVVAVADDVLDAPPSPGLFALENLQVVQVVRSFAPTTPYFSDVSPRGGVLVEASPRVAANVSSGDDDRGEFLARTSRRLTICRTPLEASVLDRWTMAQSRWTALIDECRRRQIAVALVAMPAAFQVDPALCESMRCRLGYQPGQIDLSLPQRRLADFARSESVPMLDLLPHLRPLEHRIYYRHRDRLTPAATGAALEAMNTWLQSQYPEQLAASGR